MFKTGRNGFSGSALILIAVVKFCCFSESVVAAEPKDPELILPLGHSRGVYSAALSEDGKLVLTGSSDHTAILWDVETGKPLQTFKGHTSSVMSVALSGDGRRVLTGSWDETAILWDVATANRLRIFKGQGGGVSTVAMSRDGKRVLTGSRDGTAVVWDVEITKPIQILRGHAGDVKSVAVTSDAKRVLTGSTDGTAVLWDAKTARPVQTFKGHTGGVTSVALSGDGKLVLTGSSDYSAILWDAKTAKAVRTFKGHTGEIWSVAMSGDGKRVLTGSWGKTAILWDVATARPLHTFKGHTDQVHSVAMSVDGQRILTGSSDRTAIVWDVATAKPLQSFKGYAARVTSAALSRDGKRILTGSDDHTAILWDVAAIKPIQTFKGHTDRVTSVALSGNGQRVLTGSFDLTAILWDATTAKPLQTFKGHSKVVHSVALSGDGRRVLTGSWDETAILSDAANGKPLQMFKRDAVFDNVTSVALSGDGDSVLTGALDGTATLWDVTTARPLKIFEEHTGSVSSMAISSDGKRVLTGSSMRPGSGGAGGTAILWDAATAKPIQTFKGHTDDVQSVALSSNGNRILTGSYDTTAILWDVATARPIQIFRGHDGPVRTVAFFLSDALVLTSSEDGTVRLWRDGRDQPIFSLLAAGEEWLVWTPEGYYTCSPNGENLVAWKIRDDSPQGYRIVGSEQFRKKFYLPDMFRYLVQELDLSRALALADRESGRTIEASATIANSLPPVVLITRPRRDGEIDTETVTVESVAVSVGDNPVTRMRLLLDGRPYQGNVANFDLPEPKLGQVQWSKQVDLEPGEHTLQVIAESVSEGRSEVIRIRRKAIVETLPRLFVLAIGVSAYEKASLRKDVYFAAADARNFAETVERSSKPLYREVQVIRLIDQEATRAKILQTLAQMRKRATQRDAVLIFFAGHGTRDDQTNFYFLPVEADLNDLASTGLSEGDFKAQVKGLPGRVILLLDACHSGTLIENRGRSIEGLTDKLYRDLTSNEYGLVMMCSSKGLEVSKESPELKGGFFTLAVVEGLEGKATRSSEGVVYLKALDAYVTERVKDLTDGKQHPLTSQDPNVTNIPLTKP
jgi:WD40 repeat protein